MRLILFDANALIHRAYHAIPHLSTRKGEPTGAVYGFVSMILKALSELKASYWACAFDYPAPTFRHRVLPSYKAQRPAIPSELKTQTRRAREVVEVFGMPLYELEGYEADDILGTLSYQAENMGMETIIISGDTDTLQLVSEKVKVMVPKPQRPFSDTIIYDEKLVEERYEVPPKLLPDLKALKGDPSDNIPGVPGIGEKTAIRLLKTFGSIEGIYERIEEVEPFSLRKVLKEREGEVRRSKSLTLIRRDLPIKLELDRCELGRFDRKKVVELFRELEFFSLLPRLPGERELEEAEIRIIRSIDELEEFVRKLLNSKEIAFDTETTGKDPMRAELVGISIGSCEDDIAYIPVGHRTLGEENVPLKEAIPILKKLFESDVPKIAHNGKYDMMVLSNYGIDVKNLNFDTMIGAYLLGEKAMSLKALAFNKIGVEMELLSDLIGKGSKQKSMADLPVETVARYSSKDVEVCLRLKNVIEKELEEKELINLFREVEMPLVPVLLKMEKNGIALDVELLKKMSEDMGRELRELEEKIYELSGMRFNINSPQQLASVLFDKLGLRKIKRTKSSYSTDSSVLEALKNDHPVIEHILRYRQLMKLKSTYVDALPRMVDERGRVHTNYNQASTATGRISSSDPNLQNIPVRDEERRNIRNAFIAEGDNLLISADYSQIELRILAHFSGDEKLIEAFERDEDIHTSTASLLFNVPKDRVDGRMRRLAKTVNFGVIYGISEYGLSETLGISMEEASCFIRSYFEKYPKVKEYIERTKEEVRERGYVRTLLGRRRYIPEIRSQKKNEREAAERMAINMPIQGTAADIIKIAMINIDREMERRNMSSKMLLQVHDELLFESPPEEIEDMKELILDIMPRALPLRVPLKVDVKVSKRWGEMD